MGEDAGRYYDFDLSKLQRQTLRDQNIPPHLAPHPYSPGLPYFVPVENQNTVDNSRQLEFKPFLSKGKHVLFFGLNTFLVVFIFNIKLTNLSIY